MVAQRVANAIETIAIYETKTHMARDSMDQVERQEDKEAKNASNKRKWEGNYSRSSSQQQKKDIKQLEHMLLGQVTRRDCKGTTVVANQSTITFFKCGKQGHYRSEYPELKNQKCKNQAGGSEARRKVCALGGGEADQDPNNISDNVNA
uniref:Reverse transcriptase domain-containing protein n=1 Tax=Tanacetum cinerariifolium TaxID=118510 RepID=A0A6L2ME90_TANCI|nr:hypothetical protein [Tanacetum cinerariifolium]